MDNIVGYDNLSITMHPVPEPGLHGALLLALVFVAVRRRGAD